MSNGVGQGTEIYCGYTTTEGLRVKVGPGEGTCDQSVLIVTRPVEVDV